MIRLGCSYSGRLDRERDDAIIALTAKYGGEFGGSGFDFHANMRDVDIYFDDAHQAEEAADAVTKAWCGVVEVEVVNGEEGEDV